MGSVEDEPIECVYKILLVGDLSTGKTSFVKRSVHGIFSTTYRATIGVDFALKALNWNNNTLQIRLQMWDIAGHERFGNMTRIYYQYANGAFVFCDVTRLETFAPILLWKKAIDKVMDDIPIILIVNKCDLEDNLDTVMLDNFCKEHGFIAW